MTTRILVVALIALPCVLGAHLTGLLLGAFAVAIVAARLLPVIAALAIPAAVLFLAYRIAATLLRDGWGCSPRRTA